MIARKDRAKLAVYCLAFLVLLALAVGVRDTRHERRSVGAAVDQQGQQLDRLASFTAASRASRIEFQARETFLLCSRDPSKTVIPERRDEVDATCEGYETMADAIRTERAKQDAARPPG